MTLRTSNNADETSDFRTAGEPAPSQDLTWPPERFFWGTLDAPGIRRPGVLPSAMALTFADVVPVPIEDLHAVMAPIGGTAGTEPGRVVVCAARRADLEPLLASARSLTPASLPGFIEQGGTGSQTLPLNLLVGGFEPIASRQRRHRLIARAAMLWIALVTIAIIGLLRRDAIARLHAESFRAARAAAIETAMPGAAEPDLRDAVERLERQVEARRAAARHAQGDRHARRERDLEDLGSHADGDARGTLRGNALFGHLTLPRALSLPSTSTTSPMEVRSQILVRTVHRPFKMRMSSRRLDQRYVNLRCRLRFLFAALKHSGGSCDEV